jgi:hypothetical protein
MRQQKSRHPRKRSTPTSCPTNSRISRFGPGASPSAEQSSTCMQNGKQAIRSMQFKQFQTLLALSPAAPRAALGQNRKGIRLRCSRREENPGRPVRGQKPADRVSLYVWPRMEGRVPELFLQHGSYGRRPGAPGAAGRDVSRGITRTVAQDRRVQTRTATSSTPIRLTRAGRRWRSGRTTTSILVPKGRDEDALPHTMAWVRHHDRYK